MSANATIGTYLAQWRIGSGAPGAPTLDLKTVVSAPTHHMQGAGDITQAVNPPVNVHTLVTGTFSQMGQAVVISLTGIPQLGTGIENFQCHLYLANGWNQEGVASYRFMNNGTWHQVENVKATPLHAEQAMSTGTGATASTGTTRRG
ncbi:conserved hypothetical protein [Candidatus Sulfopaludibacter sp. SbA3]|nr:conserved hypothetical protein [Candidatus Sulfopaludibacter sp. SbA3]